MQANNQQYTKKQLLDSFKKKQNDKIRELIIQETGVDLFTELPQEAVNKQQDQIALDLNDGFFRPKKTFVNSKNTNFRNDNNTKNNGGYNDFKRLPLNNRNLDGGDSQKYGRKKENSQPQVQQVKEMIPVFQECGFIQDSTIEVWYYKETEEVEGPFTSVDMDNMLYANKISFDTKVAFKDPEEKYVRIKKLITITYQDKYNHLFVEPKPVVANNDENNQRRQYFKKDFNNSNDNNNTNFSRGVPRFTKQPSDNANTSGRPQFTRSISDAKQQITETPQLVAQTNSKEEKQVPVQTVEAPKETKAPVETKPVKSTKENTKKETQQAPQIPSTTSQKKDEKKETKTAVVQEVKENPSITLPQDLEGFQTVKAGTKKKFNKKNATKIVVVGQTEQELIEEENNRRLEEIRQRDLLQQQQYEQYQKQQQKKSEVPQKKIDYFDEAEQVNQIIEQTEYFPTLGDTSTAKKTNKPAAKKEIKKQVESSDESEEEEQQKPQKTQKTAPPASKAGNKLVKTSSKQAPTNEKQQQQQVSSVDPDWIVTNKKKGKRTQEESDEEYDRQQQMINEQSRLEKLRKQKEQEEKQRIQEQQEEKRRIEEFQRRQQFQQEENFSESEEDVDPNDEKSFPTLGGAVYNGPPKNTIHNQQKKARGKTNTTYQSKALFNYVKTLEDDSWDVQPKSQPKQTTQSKPKQNKLSNDDFPSL